MAAEPALGQLDPEDQDSEEEEPEIGLVGETPKHFAVQVGCAMGGGRGLVAVGQRWSPAKSSCHFSGRGHAGTTFAPREALSLAGKCGSVLLVPLSPGVPSLPPLRMFGPWQVWRAGCRRNGQTWTRVSGEYHPFP